jgi:hypothetical protein
MITSALEVRCQFAQTIYDESGMSLPGWYEVVLHAKVDLQRSALEPASSTVGEVCGLGDFWNAQDVLIERPCRILTAGWHCKLDVIEAMDLHLSHPVSSTL